MLGKSYDLNLDIYNKSSVSDIEFVKGDKNSCFLVVTITSQGQPVDLTGLTIQFNIKKSDDTVVLQSMTSIDFVNAAAGIIKITLLDQSLAASGEAFADISISNPDGSNKLTTTEFKFNVRPEKGDDNTILSSNEFSALDEKYKTIMEQTSAIVASYDNAIKDRTNVLLEKMKTDVNNNTYNDANARLNNIETIKANVADVRRNTALEPITLKELSTEVKQAMTGGSVAVVGLNAVGNENVKDKSINSQKVDSSILKNNLINLLSTSLNNGNNVNGATFTQVDSKTFNVTSTTNYGTFSRVITVEQSRKYIFISKVLSNDANIVGKTARTTAYCYDSNGVNLGEADGTAKVTVTGVAQMLVSQPYYMKANSIIARFGVTVTTPGTFQVSGQMVLDVTGIPDDILAKIDFSKINGGYWDSNVENTIVYSKFSDSAATAEQAKIASFAQDGNFAKLTTKYTNITGDSTQLLKNNSLYNNGATVVQNADLSYTIAFSASWGSMLVKTPVTASRTYLISAKVKANTPTDCNFTCFQYDTNGTNLGSVNSIYPDSVVTTEWNLKVATFTIDKPTAIKMNCGIINTSKNTPITNIDIKDIMIIDITDTPLTLTQIQSLGGYWSTNPQLSNMAEKALVAMSLDPSIVLPSQSTLKNRKWTSYGDSITQGNTWQPYVVNKLGIINTNRGIGGTTIVNNTSIAWLDSNNNYLARPDNGGTQPPNSVEIKSSMSVNDRINTIPVDTQIITILGGVNDYFQAQPIGAISDTVDTTFYGALQIMLTKIQTRIPNATIVVMLPIFYTGEKTANSKGLYLEDYRKAIRDVANLFGFPIIDLKNECGINALNMATYLNADGIHPIDAGGKKMAQIISNRLRLYEPLT